jgi:hypothetical protein
LIGPLWGADVIVLCSLKTKRNIKVFHSRPNLKKKIIFDPFIFANISFFLKLDPLAATGLVLFVNLEPESLRLRGIEFSLV